ncbi:hypothetical protein [Butyrivibrio sp. AE3004]|uniref:hypothetical protein n=1 Tax=Butyrivibrio sp. AE3004 TaxID=1506994 RepID=UPI00049489B8|nr:hypothetical protein [Butyrivibrio sp. AE3004]
MDIEKIMNERHELLLRMRDELQSQFIAAEIREPEQENMPAILSVLFDELGFDDDEAFGEFFFYNIPSEDADIQHFAAVITIADDIPSDHLPELFEAMSYINRELPCGSYSIDSDKKFLTFRLTVPLSLNMTGDELYEEMDIVIGNAMALVDTHMDILLKILSGEKDIDYVKESLNKTF